MRKRDENSDRRLLWAVGGEERTLSLLFYYLTDKVTLVFTCVIPCGETEARRSEVPGPSSYKVPMDRNRTELNSGYLNLSLLLPLFPNATSPRLLSTLAEWRMALVLL